MKNVGELGVYSLSRFYRQLHARINSTPGSIQLMISYGKSGIKLCYENYISWEFIVTQKAHADKQATQVYEEQNNTKQVLYKVVVRLGAKAGRYKMSNDRFYCICQKYHDYYVT